MSPTYFHERLTYYEAEDFVTGFNRRCRHVYESARLVHGIVGGLFAKNYKVPEFPWDRDPDHHKVHEYTANEIEDFKLAGEAFAAELNRKAQS